ncbi:hypothetical protein, partial [Escherichia coli]|uniref:hypothetical protein n=1 Tax=Escherichia coli TaxID=562 RepID=UPI001AA0FC30
CSARRQQRIHVPGHWATSANTGAEATRLKERPWQSQHLLKKCCCPIIALVPPNRLTIVPGNKAQQRPTVRTWGQV